MYTVINRVARCELSTIDFVPESRYSFSETKPEKCLGVLDLLNPRVITTITERLLGWISRKMKSIFVTKNVTKGRRDCDLHLFYVQL